MLQRCSASYRASRPAFSRARVAPAASSGNGAPKSFKEGSRVKVVSPITIYSVPKHPDGLSILGMEGEVAKDVTQFKGKVLSANLPLLVKFKTSSEGVDVKFNAHLAEDEIQALE